MHPDDDPSWNFYPQTLLHFQECGLVVDLRSSLSGAQQAALWNLGLGHQFSVITAHNPRGCGVTDDENDGLHERLMAVLQALGVQALPCIGSDPTKTHKEAGLAASLPEAHARIISVCFEQSAYFFFDGSSFWLMPALVKNKKVRLPTKPLLGRASPDLQ